MTSDPDEPEPASLHPKRIENPDQQFFAAGNKDLRKLQKTAWKAGWWPEKKKSGILWMAPDGEGQVLVHGSASDHHALKNTKSTFRAAGLDL